jgi:hypothetical protein
MVGQFLFPSGRSIGFRVRALIRNTPRERGHHDADGAYGPIGIDLSVYRAGEMLATYPNFGEVTPDSMLEISDANCPELGTEGEHLVVAVCSRGSGRDYFAQEHQLIYERPGSGTFTTLLYDQLPLPRTGADASPIVLLAPKAWVSTELSEDVPLAVEVAAGGSPVFHAATVS